MGDTLVVNLRRNEVSATFHQSLLELALYDKGAHILESQHVRCNMNDLPVGRNKAMERLIESGAEWLLFIDSDMGFAPTALETLKASADPVERPVVGGLCFAQRDFVADGKNGFRYEIRATIMDWLPFPDGHERFSFRPYHPVNMLAKCDATGAAFLLIHRSVAMRMLNRYGKTWFDRLDAGDDGIMSEDISFFKRLLDMDGPGRVHIHTGVRVTHQKETWLGETDFWQAFDPPPALERVDVIVPVLHRPQNVRTFMESLTASTGLATAWFVCEPGDVEEIDEIFKYGGEVIEFAGSFAKKVNFAHEATGLEPDAAPWVFPVGDDVSFHAGWLDHAQFVAHAFGAAVIGTNDLGNPRVMRGDHATHMLLARNYVDALGGSWDDVGAGKICFEGYGHWYVDDEIVTAARQRGEFQMALGSLVEHMHPLFNKGDGDDVYAKGLESAERDRAIFEARLSKFFKVAA
jgi:hypothetical protein